MNHEPMSPSRSRGSSTTSLTAGVVAALMLSLAVVPAVLAAPRPERGGQSGNFHVLCQLSHVLADDPIVRPGQPGASHLHDFFGNRSADASSTFGSMTGAGTSCNFAPDRAGYWAPSLIAPNGSVISPRHMTAYYFGQGGDVVAPPSDLRIVAGGDTGDLSRAGYACGEGQPTSHVPMRCSNGLDMKGVVTFPSCWDGSRLDSSDHRSHLAYPEGGNCGGQYPVTLPKLVVHVTYGITDGRGYRLSSDANFNTTDGRSLHADFWNTWEQSALIDAVRDCIHAGIRCNLGQGTSGSSPDAPMVESIHPTSGSFGTAVTIQGRRLGDVFSVEFNGVPATFTVDSNRRIDTFVPSGATSGPIVVSSPDGSAASPGQFSVIGMPSVRRVKPSIGAVGSSVVIIGSYFTGATSVRFGDVSASFAVNGDGMITTTVPPGAGSGRVSVSTPIGTDLSPARFVVSGTGATHVRKIALRLRGGLWLIGRVSVPDGFGSCGAHATVAPQRSTRHGWVTLDRVKTGPQGRYHGKVRDRTGRYRATIGRRRAPADPCGAATSPVKRHRRS
jgi:hypothetical protein